MTRTQIVAETFDQTLITVADLCRRAGCSTFELEYDSTSRDLADDEQPRPGEDVRWTATARHPTRGTLTGTASGSGNHARLIRYALVRLVEALGANTIVVDVTDDEEPAR